MGIIKTTTRLRQVNLNFVVLTTLTLLSLVPLAVFFLFTQKEIISELHVLEEDQQIHRMEDKLNLLETRIENYKEMIGFVSQLPAVIEILNKGEIRAGSISRETAHARYTGVLTRAFKKYNDVISINILDLKENIQFSLLKELETSKYHRVTDRNIDFNPAFLSKTLEMNDKDFFLSPLFLSDENMRRDESAKLFLRIFTPIFFEKEKIGIFCSDIDIGILAQSYPKIHWVLNNGSYLSAGKSKKTAFANFPGLRKIFISGKSGVWGNDNTVMAWVPFFKGKDVSLVLWAGEKIDLVSVQTARKKMIMNMLSVFLILLAISLSISFFLSRYTKRVSAQFLENFEQSIIHQKKGFWNWNKRIRELSEFNEKIDSILDKNATLEEKRQQALRELQQSLDEVKTLRGILPICSFCKKIRNDEGYYERIESYIHKHSGVDFSHTICTPCMEEHYPKEYESIVFKKKS